MKNPYRKDSTYAKLFDFMQKAGKFARSAVVMFARSSLHLAEKAAEAAVTVVMSPRAESTRGDCRGNISAQGHLYYVEKLAQKTVKGEKQEREFRIRARAKALARKTRNDKAGKGKSKKSKKVAKKVTKKVSPKKSPAPQAAPAAPQAAPEPATA